MLLPFEVNVIPLFFTMAKLKLLNTIPGVTLPLIALPIGVFLLRQFFINIPRDLEDARSIVERQGDRLDRAMVRSFFESLAAATAEDDLARRAEELLASDD